LEGVLLVIGARSLLDMLVEGSVEVGGGGGQSRGYPLNALTTFSTSEVKRMEGEIR